MGRLELKPTDRKGIREGIMKDGRKLSVRDDRRRYFFPDEWEEFISKIKNKEHKFLFITLLHTGARIMEALNLKHENIEVDRGTITFNVVKQRKAKKNFYAIGKSRSFFVASNFIKEYKSFIRNKNINKKEYIFLDNSKLPKDYDDLNNKERRKYFISKSTAYSQLLKRKLKKANIEDWYNFSLHNIRKTYGNWMRTFDIQIAELCYRMGHDIDTYISYYGSSLIFTPEERRKISRIMGDIK